MNLCDVDMRAAYIDALIELARADERIVVLDADLAASTGTARFADAFPARFFNCGIQEANMVGVAAGLAAKGFLPFVHSFGAFAGRRAVDQVFLSCAYAGLNVRIVGVDPGITAAKNGGTHMSLEDIGIMSTIPNITILDPSDAECARQMLCQCAAAPGVYYIRLHRKARQMLYGPTDTVTIGRANRLLDGSDVTLIAEGAVCVPEAVKAAEMLRGRGVSARVLDMSTVKPLDEDALLLAARETGAIVTVENHNVVGGLGSAVAASLANHHPAPMRLIGVPDVFGQVGTLEELQALYGLCAEGIAEAAMELCGRKPANNKSSKEIGKE